MFPELRRGKRTDGADGGFRRRRWGCYERPSASRSHCWGRESIPPSPSATTRRGSSCSTRRSTVGKAVPLSRSCFSVAVGVPEALPKCFVGENATDDESSHLVRHDGWSSTSLGEGRSCVRAAVDGRDRSDHDRWRDWDATRTHRPSVRAHARAWRCAVRLCYTRLYLFSRRTAACGSARGVLRPPLCCL